MEGVAESDQQECPAKTVKKWPARPDKLLPSSLCGDREGEARAEKESGPRQSVEDLMDGEELRRFRPRGKELADNVTLEHDQYKQTAVQVEEPVPRSA